MMESKIIDTGPWDDYTDPDGRHWRRRVLIESLNGHTTIKTVGEVSERRDLTRFAGYVLRDGWQPVYEIDGSDAALATEPSSVAGFGGLHLRVEDWFASEYGSRARAKFRLVRRNTWLIVAGVVPKAGG